MRLRWFGAIAVVMLTGCHVEQVQLGQWYRIVTPPAGACPSLEWQFVIAADRSIGGFVSPDRVTKLATLKGTLAPDDTYSMTATAKEGTATVTGQFSSLSTIFAIKGDALGANCNGQVFKLWLGRYFQSQSGGGGGG